MALRTGLANMMSRGVDVAGQVLGPLSTVTNVAAPQALRAPGDLDHLGWVGELDPRTSGGLTTAAFSLVDRVPAVARNKLRLAHCEQLLQRAPIAVGSAEPAGDEVRNDVVDRLAGTVLVGTDRAISATLDPSGDVDAWDRLPVLGDRPTTIVGDDSAMLIERQAGQWPAPEAYRAQHHCCLDLLGLVGCDGFYCAVNVDELVGGDPHSLNAVGPLNFDRGNAVAEYDALVVRVQRT